MKWLINSGASFETCKDESSLILNPDNFNKVERGFLSKINFNQYNTEEDLYNTIVSANHYTHKDILVGTKSWSIHPMSLIP